MLGSLFSGNLNIEYIKNLLLSIPIVLFSLSLHEFAHGYVAYKMGDPTARNLGRLTLNPIKHLDPLGTLSMILFRFGWAKPVPINTRYFKSGKKGMALTALAGPISNLLLAFVGVIIYTVLNIPKLLPNTPYSEVIVDLFALLIILNTYLAVFNLLPIPPFDGSRLAFVFLPDRLYFGIMKYERYIMLGLIVLLYIGILRLPLMWISDNIINGMFFVVGLIPGL